MPHKGSSTFKYINISIQHLTHSVMVELSKQCR